MGTSTTYFEEHEMTWTLSASGHVRSPEEEAHLVGQLREVFGPYASAGDVQVATLFTTHHGTVDLLQPGATPADEVAGDGSGEALPELEGNDAGEERLSGSTGG